MGGWETGGEVGGGGRPRAGAVISSCRRLSLESLVRGVPRAGGLAGGRADRRTGGRAVEPR